jgi:hypothetical protein
VLESPTFRHGAVFQPESEAGFQSLFHTCGKSCGNLCFLAATHRKS